MGIKQVASKTVLSIKVVAVMSAGRLHMITSSRVMRSSNWEGYEDAMMVEPHACARWHDSFGCCHRFRPELEQLFFA